MTNHNIFFPVATSIVTILIYFTYQLSIYPFYQYMGYSFYPMEWMTLVILSLCVGMLSLSLPKELHSPSDLVSFFVFFQVVIPALTTPFYVIEKLDLLTWIPYWMIVCSTFIFVCNIRKFPGFNLSIYLKRKICIALLVLFSLCTFLVLLTSYNVNFSSLFNLSGVHELYALRMGYREETQNVNIFAQYFFSWDAKVLVPLMVIIGVVYKSKILISFGLIMQLAIFSINGQKSVALGLFIVLGIYWIVGKRNSGVKLFYIVYSSVFFFLSLDLLVGVDVFSNVIVRRMFVMPGLLTGYYIDFYSAHDMHNYANSSLSFLFDKNYSEAPAHIIGKYFFGRDEMAANANLFASAYANFGILSVFIESMIFCVVMYLISNLAKNKNKKVVISLFTLPLISLSDSALLTSLLTNGIMLATLITIILWKDDVKTYQ